MEDLIQTIRYFSNLFKNEFATNAILCLEQKPLKTVKFLY